jgi:hypothetical protein
MMMTAGRVRRHCLNRERIYSADRLAQVLGKLKLPCRFHNLVMASYLQCCSWAATVMLRVRTRESALWVVGAENLVHVRRPGGIR